MGYSTDEKAEAIVTSALHTDAEAAKICDVSARSIKRWRSQMEDRPELARAVTLKWNRAREESNWAESATHAIQKGLSFLREATERLNPGDPEQPVQLDGTRRLSERPMLRELSDGDQSTTRQLAVAAFNALGQRIGDLAARHSTVRLTDREGADLSTPGSAADGTTQGLPRAVTIGTDDRMVADTRWMQLMQTQDLRQQDTPYFKIADAYNAITFREYELGEKVDLGFVETGETIYEAGIHAAALQWQMLWESWQDIWQSGDGLAAMQAEYLAYQAKTAYSILTASPGTSVSWQGASEDSQTKRDIRTINEGIRQVKKALFEAESPGGEQLEEQLEGATFALLYDSLEQNTEDRVNSALDVRLDVDADGQADVAEVRANVVPIGTPYVSGGPYVVLPGRKNVLGLSRDLTMYDIMDARVAGVAEGSVGQAAWRMVQGDTNQTAEITLG